MRILPNGPHFTQAPEGRRAMRRLDAAARADNREIERQNRRRRQCAEKILELAILGQPVRARVWVTKLGSAGFSAADTQAFERLCTPAGLPRLEREIRALLGLREVNQQ